MILETKITIEEIKDILIKNTVVGNPRIKGTPFAHFTFYDKEKAFFGKTEKSKFEITHNSLYFSIPYYLSGSIKNGDGKAIIEYEVKKNLFGFYWIYIGIPVVILILNWMMFKIGEIPAVIIILFNFLLLFVVIVINGHIEYRKSKLIRNLKTVLKADQKT